MSEKKPVHMQQFSLWQADLPSWPDFTFETNFFELHN